MSQTLAKHLKSTKAVAYIAQQLNPTHIRSLTVAGSKPEQLGPGADLDIFVIMKEEHASKGFEQLNNTLQTIQQQHPETTYTFLRAPIKYENKGLIHILGYTDSNDTTKPESWRNENINVLNSIATTGDTIIGDSIEDMLKTTPFPETRKHTDKQNALDKWTQYKHNRTVDLNQWMETPDGWHFVKGTFTPGPYWNKTIEKYAQKHHGLYPSMA